jgi:hypothetical protein
VFNPPSKTSHDFRTQPSATLRDCTGFPLEKELAKEVNNLPAVVGGKLIAEGTEILTVAEAG